MEYLIGAVILFFIYKKFSGGNSNKGVKLQPWQTKFKCAECGHNRFVDVMRFENDRYDSVEGFCAKCGTREKVDGPNHPK